jgi:trehalose synthase
MAGGVARQMVPRIMRLSTVPVGSLSLSSFEGVVPPGVATAVQLAQRLARLELSGRRIWNVNSTARGGGVAEMLITLLAYARGAGVDARWVVVGGDDPFFRVTKRIHNRLHGIPGDGGPLGDEERTVYEATLAPNGSDLCEMVAPGDIVILHDPQTAGLVPQVRERGVPAIWRCHVGLDVPNDLAREAWWFLEPYVMQADAYVFSREAFVWEELDPRRRAIIAPSIDVFSPKNQELTDDEVRGILAATGLRSGNGGRPQFRRIDGATGTVRSRAHLIEERQLTPDDRYVLQVSRWDTLKDPLGVIEGFARHVAEHTDAHLVYAGPDVVAVADDPEGAAVLAAAHEAWHQLPRETRERVHLALLPMEDGEENAAIVNAVQRAADVVVQKSLAEGFGLTVAEGMWKSRPVVASRIGGIQDQIEDGRSGVLLDDPTDLAAYGAAVRELLDSPARAAAIGQAARERVRERFLGTHSLLDYLMLLEGLLK